jgi:hypothetical protein
MSIKPRTTRKRRSEEKGAILIVAIIVVFSMLILAIPFLFKLSAQFRTTEKSYRSTAAFNLAEAGVERALWELNNFLVSDWEFLNEEYTWLKGTIDDFAAPDGNVVGDIEMEIKPPYPVGDTEMRQLEGKGLVPFLAQETVDREVRVNLEKHMRSIFDFGIFADEGMHFDSNATTDSYNSDDNPDYDFNQDERGTQGHIGTNNTEEGSITLDANAEIYGSMAAGTGTDADAIDDVLDTDAASTYVDGVKKILPSPFEMPPVDFYNLPPRDMFDHTTTDYTEWFVGQATEETPLLYDPWDTQLNWEAINTDSGVLPAGAYDTGNGYFKGGFGTPKHGSFLLTEAYNGIYSSFILDVQSEVVVPNGHNVSIYVTAPENMPNVDPLAGAFEFKSGATLVIEEGASLTMILGYTSYLMRSNTVMNENGIPSTFLVLGTEEFEGEFHWNSNTDTYAAMYMPNADVHYDSNYEMFGAIICDYLDLNANAHLHYDEALGDIDWIKGGVPYWVVTSWQEVRHR